MEYKIFFSNNILFWFLFNFRTNQRYDAPTTNWRPNTTLTKTLRAVSNLLKSTLPTSFWLRIWFAPNGITQCRTCSGLSYASEPNRLCTADICRSWRHISTPATPSSSKPLSSKPVTMRCFRRRMGAVGYWLRRWSFAIGHWGVRRLTPSNYVGRRDWMYAFCVFYSLIG